MTTYEWNHDYSAAQVYRNGQPFVQLHRLPRGWAVITGRDFKLYDSEMQARAAVPGRR